MTEERFIQILDERLDRKLDERFAQQEQRFDEIDAKIANLVTEEQFANLYAFMQFRFDEVDKRFDAMEARFDAKLDKKADKEQLNQILHVVEGLAKNFNSETGQQAATNHRHKGWIGQLAKNTRTKLVPEL